MKKLFFLMISVLILFTGCAPIYDIQPKYNKETQVLRIDSLQFDKVRQTLNKSKNSQNGTQVLQKYSIKNKECHTLIYKEVSANIDYSYIKSNLDEELQQRYLDKKIGNCKVVEISNLKFYKCTANSQWNDIEHLIGTSVSSPYGYSDISRIKTDSTCFNTLLNHFMSKAQLKDKIKVESFKFSDIESK